MRIVQLIIVPTILLCFSANAQTYNTLIPDSVIHGFIQVDILHSPKYPEERKHRKKVMVKQLLQWDGLLYRSKNDTSSKDIGNVVKLLFSTKRNAWLDTLFSNEDKGYLLKQLQDSKPVQAWHTRFRWVRTVRTTNAKSGFYRYSVPLFNIAGNILAIRRAFYCGELCSYRSVRIYKLVNHIWTFIGEVEAYMS